MSRISHDRIPYDYMNIETVEDLPLPISRIGAYLYLYITCGIGINPNYSIENIEITENGVYEAPEGVLYNSVTTEVPSEETEESSLCFTTTIGNKGQFTMKNMAEVGVVSQGFIDDYIGNEVDTSENSVPQVVALSKAYSLPNGMLSMNDTLEELYLPEAVMITQCLCYKATKLDVVSIPKVGTIGKMAFFMAGNDNKGVTLGFSIVTPYLSSIFNEAFEKSNIRLIDTTNIYGSVSNKLYIGAAVFRESSLITAILPNLEELVMGYEFQDCINLISLELNALKVIANHHTFDGCSSLAYVEFPNLQTIDGNGVGGAFMDCINLRRINLPKLTTAEVTDLFNNCYNLTDFYAPYLSSISGYGCFYGCTNLVDVELSSLINTQGYMFNGCENLTELILDSCTEVGAYTFAYNEIDDIEPAPIISYIFGGDTVNFSDYAFYKNIDFTITLPNITDVPTCDTDVETSFSDIESFTIFVPESIYNTIQNTSTIWDDYRSNIRNIAEEDNG